MTDPRELFLRGAWKSIPSEDDFSWVEDVAKTQGTTTPLGDIGPLIKGMLDKGVSAYHIARFAKIIGYETAFGLLYHLDDPNDSYEGFPSEEEVAWSLYLVDDNHGYQPIERMGGLYESFLSMDPSGREMRPKNA